MKGTRRFWTIVGLIILFAFWALILERPYLLAGSVLLSGMVLANQYRFVRTANREIAALSVKQYLDRNRLNAGETTLGTLSVELPNSHNNEIIVRSGIPESADASEIMCVLSPSELTAQETFTITWPIAGSFSFKPPRVTVTDSFGLFEQTTTAGPTPTVTIEPRAQQDIHIGEGGNPIAVGFGEHEAGEMSSGLIPAELRKYVPGDSTGRIDWKATARLQEAHVREFEAETDLETQLIFDHRAAMSADKPAVSKLDFARQVGLALVANAEEFGDPLGWYSVGDDGITDRLRPRTKREQYQVIADRLRRLESTEGPITSQTESVSPDDAKALSTKLTGTDTFDQQLKPFFSATNSYIQHIATDPLFETIRIASTELEGAVRTIVITDDSCRTELREAVKMARRGTGTVVVFLTPTILYELESVADVTDAYRQYKEFETFRRDLASMDHVSAFEVGPSDSMQAVLETSDWAMRADQ